MAAPVWAQVQVFEGRLLYANFSAAAPSFETFQSEFLHILQQALDADVPFRLIVDSSQMSTVPLEIGFEIVKFMRRNQPKFKSWCRASAIIVSHSFIRGLLEWVFTLSPPVSPNIVCQSKEEAVAFVEQFKEPVTSACS